MNGAPPQQPTGDPTGPGKREPVKKSSRRWLTQLITSKAHWFTRWPAASILNTCLLGTLAVDGLAVLKLAVVDLNYTTGIYDSVGDAILFAIAGANFLAIIFLLYLVASWAAAAFIAQTFVLALVVYIMLIDLKSPKLNSHIMWAAGVNGLLAFVWLLVLARHAIEPFKRFTRFTKTAVIITALIPLSAGSLQFYVQNYFIPLGSEPTVDVSAELSPQSKTSSITHLSAKVTVHNRGLVRVNVAGALMRVTAYPSTAPQQQPPQPQQEPGTQKQEPTAVCKAEKYYDAKWCQIGDGLDLSRLNGDTDFRYNPPPAVNAPVQAPPVNAPVQASPVNAQVLYAGLFMLPGDYLLPGETDTVEREVDIDPANVRLARLSVSAVFLTERNIKATVSCWRSRANAYTDPTSFSFEVNLPRHFSDQPTLPIIDRRLRASYFCVDSEFAPRSIVDHAIGNQGVLRVLIWLNDPQVPGREYPRIDFGYYLVDARSGDILPDPDGHINNKLKKGNPLAYTDLTAEYAPGDPIKTDGKG
jgi:hypothetical protein